MIFLLQDSRAVPPTLMCRTVEANKAPENISEKGSHLQVLKILRSNFVRWSTLQAVP